MSAEAESMRSISGLHPAYRTYERQKCFIGHSREAEWRDDILSACTEVLPRFGLEPWYAADHFDPTKPLRDKVVELVANARYGIYDLSSWQDRDGEWHLPRDVFIELGMAIVLNRPALLLRHTSNTALPLPACLQGVERLEFAGETTLKKALEERLPQWFEVPPERDWLNRFCILGNRVCGFRKEHPRARQWGHGTLRCHISDGLDKDHRGFQRAERAEIRGAFEDVLSRYSDLEFDHLDELLLADGYQFLLCSCCQTVRSTPFAFYHILPQTSAETFIVIGMSIALEAFFGYDIPKVLLVRQEQALPSLLRGYEVVEAINSSEVKRKLKAFVPTVMRKVRETAWKPRLLPFIETLVSPADGTRFLERKAGTLGSTAGLREVLHQIVTSTQRTLECDAVALFVYNQMTEKLEHPPTMVGVGYPERAMRYGEVLKDSIVYEMLQRDEPYVVEAVAQDALFRGKRFAQDEGIESCVAIPLHAAGQKVGVMFVNHRTRHHFPREELSDIEQLAYRFAAAIRDAQILEETTHGYDVQFLITGEGLDPDTVRQAITEMGESVLVVGDATTIKVHVHTPDPGLPIAYAASLGSLRDVVVEDMQEFGVVAVVAGDGLTRVFQGLGVGAIVHGSQMMNPSSQDLLDAVEKLPAERAILLPNNSNVILTAEQTRSLSSKPVTVIPTRFIPQGIAALSALNHQADFETNVAAMAGAMQEIETGEVTTAARMAKINSVQVAEGQIIGLHNGELAVSGATVEEVVQGLLERMGAAERETITLYYGEGVSQSDADALAEQLHHNWLNQEIRVVAGGQPHYQYFVSLE